MGYCVSLGNSLRSCVLSSKSNFIGSFLLGKMSSVAPHSTMPVKDRIEILFRTIRIGSLRTFPVKFKSTVTAASGNGIECDNFKPALFSEKGIKFSIALEEGGEQDATITISFKHIQRIHIFAGRSCPVLWIKPDKDGAERVRASCGMRKRGGPYLDPESTADQEHEVALILAQDPLPFAVAHSIQRICYCMAKKKNMRQNKFFKEINHKENNDKLVRCTVYMDNIENHRYGLSQTDAVNPVPEEEPPDSNVEPMSESSDDYSDYDVSDSVTTMTDASDPDYQMKNTSKCGQNKTPKPILIKSVPKKAQEGSASSCSSKQADDNDESLTEKENKEQRAKQLRETPLVIIQEKTAEIQMEDFEAKRRKQVEESPDRTQNLPSTPMTSSPSSGSPRKVHRARKSIPSRHRTVSIESQLKARIEQQKESMYKNFATSTDQATKRKLDDSDATDNTSKLSESESSLPELKKKNKRRDSIGLNPKKKRKKKIDESSESSSASDTIDNTTVNALSVARSAKSECKTLSVNLQVKTLQQHITSSVQLSPLCTCVVKSPHKFRLSSNEINKCMAVEYVDGRLNGCNEDITQPEMFRPSNKIPVLGMCNDHRERMIRHESCPGCGTFCVAGTFLVCLKNSDCPHRFHKECVLADGRHEDCPHCGSDLSHVKEVNIAPGKDENLSSILAAHKPEKTRLKEFPSIRNALRSTLNPEKIPGITSILAGVTIDLSNLAPAFERRKLVEVVANLQKEPSKKLRFQPKVFLQYIRENDVTKVLHTLNDATVHATTLDMALLLAVPDGCLSLIHVLLQAGADINARYENGDTPLIRAVQKKMKKLIFYLIINKADVDVMNEEGMTALHAASMDGYVDGLHLLHFYGKSNVNSRSEGDYTPIMWAAEHKQATMAKYLIQCRASVSAIDDEGNSCLHWAALAGNAGILKLGLQRNSDPNYRNSHGDTPLHVAARENNKHCICLLLAYGADPMIKNKDKETPLDCTPEQNTAWMTMKVNQWIRKAGFLKSSPRTLPLNRERLLCDDMSRGYERIPIPCVNAVDAAPCPTKPHTGFHYVTDHVHTSADININHVISSLQFCSCTDGCATASCSCALISDRCWYAEDGTLLPNFNIQESPLIFECNSMCKCGKSCRNRVVQTGMKYRLQVYRTVDMGWGLRTLETIPRGAYVCEYVGELLRDADADSRDDDTYLFELDNRRWKTKDGDGFCVDARYYGNVSRFINHHCEPNLFPVRVLVDHHDVRFPKICFFTSRAVKAYEEVGFDYGDGFWDIKHRQITCRCKSTRCKYSAEANRIRAAKHAGEQEDGNNSTIIQESLSNGEG